MEDPKTISENGSLKNHQLGACKIAIPVLRPETFILGSRNGVDRDGLRIELDWHLIGRKMNLRAGFFTILMKIILNKEVKGGFFVEYHRKLNSIWGGCASRREMFHVTEAGHANWRRVVGRLTGEKPPLREVGPPEQLQRDLRMPLAQPRPPATHRKQSRPPQTHFFVALHLESCTTNHHITTSLKCSTAMSPSLLPVWGDGAAPAYPRDA